MKKEILKKNVPQKIVTENYTEMKIEKFRSAKKKKFQEDFQSF